MIYDNSDSRITDQLSGRTIDHVIRSGKQIELVCADGHVIILQADIDGDIHHRKTDVRITLPNVSMLGGYGRMR
jgi:hypothetical protein